MSFGRRGSSTTITTGHLFSPGGRFAADLGSCRSHANAQRSTTPCFGKLTSRRVVSPGNPACLPRSHLLPRHTTTMRIPQTWMTILMQLWRWYGSRIHPPWSLIVLLQPTATSRPPVAPSLHYHCTSPLILAPPSGRWLLTSPHLFAGRPPRRSRSHLQEGSERDLNPSR